MGIDDKIASSRPRSIVDVLEVDQPSGNALHCCTW